MNELIAKLTTVLWLALCVGVALGLLVTAVLFNAFIMLRNAFAKDFKLPKAAFSR